MCLGFTSDRRQRERVCEFVWERGKKKSYDEVFPLASTLPHKPAGAADKKPLFGSEHIFTGLVEHKKRFDKLQEKCYLILSQSLAVPKS